MILCKVVLYDYAKWYYVKLPIWLCEISLCKLLEHLYCFENVVERMFCGFLAKIIGIEFTLSLKFVKLYLQKIPYFQSLVIFALGQIVLSYDHL